MLRHSTIAANVVQGGFPDDGGGIFNDGGITIKNTIVAGNLNEDGYLTASEEELMAAATPCWRWTSASARSRRSPGP